MNAKQTEGRELACSFHDARAALAQLARDDFQAFSELVLKDESSGAPVVLAPYHREWCDLLNRHERLLIFSHIESAKSSLVAVGYVLWMLGRDPSLRAAVVSNTHHQAVKLVRTLARYIADSEELRLVFPDLKPGTPWAPDSGTITIQRRVTAKDASVVASGLHGAVLGARLDLVVGDDLEDWESTRTGENREKTAGWWASTIMGRLTARGRVVVCGVPWHPDDLLGRLSRSSGWVTQRYPVVDSDSGESRWPERWPLSRIAKVREELGPLDAGRQLDVVARDDASAVFKQEWLQAALGRGVGKRLLPHLLNANGCKVVAGVDLGVATHAKADETSIAVVLIHRDQSRELIGLQSGRWSAPQIIERIITVNRAFAPAVMLVETVAAQRHLADMVKAQSSVPIQGFVTGAGKRSLPWEAEKLSVELSNGKWVLPCESNGQPIGEVAKLVSDLLLYSPQGHCPDRVVGLLLARHAAERASRRVQFGRIDLVTR